MNESRVILDSTTDHRGRVIREVPLARVPDDWQGCSRPWRVSRVFDLSPSVGARKIAGSCSSEGPPRGGYQTTFGQRRLFVRGEMKEGQRAAPSRVARCQRKYAPRVFQNTLANVPGPIDQEITGNDIRASLCSTGRVRENLTLSRLPVSSLSKHVIFLWERVFRTNYHCLLFFPLIVERCKFNFLQMCCMFFFKKHLRV